jgi:hypothetical protein
MASTAAWLILSLCWGGAASGLDEGDEVTTAAAGGTGGAALVVIFGVPGWLGSLTMSRHGKSGGPQRDGLDENDDVENVASEGGIEPVKRLDERFSSWSRGRERPEIDPVSRFESSRSVRSRVSWFREAGNEPERLLCERSSRYSRCRDDIVGGIRPDKLLLERKRSLSPERGDKSGMGPDNRLDLRLITLRPSSRDRAHKAPVPAKFKSSRTRRVTRPPAQVTPSHVEQGEGLERFQVQSEPNRSEEVRKSSKAVRSVLREPEAEARVQRRNVVRRKRQSVLASAISPGDQERERERGVKEK